jgi:hypothetical protein
MTQPLNAGKGRGSSGVWRAGWLGFVMVYPGGFTVRAALLGTLIVRWRGYVPAELPGRRIRLGRVEIHTRKTP